jgi:hypothetical protein
MRDVTPLEIFSSPPAQAISLLFSSHYHCSQEEGDAREIRWHIDSLPQHSSSGLDRLVFNQDSTPDIITAVAASDSMLLVARASGAIIRYRWVKLLKTFVCSL